MVVFACLYIWCIRFRLAGSSPLALQALSRVSCGTLSKALARSMEAIGVPRVDMYRTMVIASWIPSSRMNPRCAQFRRICSERVRARMAARVR